MGYSELILPYDRLLLLISQWKNDVPVIKVIQEAMRIVDEYLIQPQTRIEDSAAIDLATGVLLNWVGQRVGLIRLSVDDPSAKLGFSLQTTEEDGRLGFQGRMHSVNPLLGSRVGISDDYFRPIIKARYLALKSIGTASEVCTTFDVLFSSIVATLCSEGTTPNNIEIDMFQSDDVFWDAVRSELPRYTGIPAGIGFLVRRHPTYELLVREESLTSVGPQLQFNVGDNVAMESARVHIAEVFAPESEFTGYAVSLVDTETPFSIEIVPKLGVSKIQDVKVWLKADNSTGYYDFSLTRPHHGFMQWELDDDTTNGVQRITSPYALNGDLIDDLRVSILRTPEMIFKLGETAQLHDLFFVSLNTDIEDDLEVSVSLDTMKSVIGSTPEPTLAGITLSFAKTNAFEDHRFLYSVALELTTANGFVSGATYTYEIDFDYDDGDTATLALTHGKYQFSFAIE